MKVEKKTQNPVEILLVEDSSADADLTIEAFKSAEFRSHISVVEDGMEAMAFLLREGKHARAPRPGLILLDLNLPKKNGREVLVELKGHRDLRRIPVIVLTTSKDDNDVMESYQLHANGYVAKPADFEQFSETVKSIGDFWLTWAILPPR